MYILLKSCQTFLQNFPLCFSKTRKFLTYTQVIWQFSLSKCYIFTYSRHRMKENVLRWRWHKNLFLKEGLFLKIFVCCLPQFILGGGATQNAAISYIIDNMFHLFTMLHTYNCFVQYSLKVLHICFCTLYVFWHSNVLGFQIEWMN